MRGIVTIVIIALLTTLLSSCCCRTRDCEKKLGTKTESRDWTIETYTIDGQDELQHLKDSILMCQDVLLRLEAPYNKAGGYFASLISCGNSGSGKWGTTEDCDNVLLDVSVDSIAVFSGTWTIVGLSKTAADLNKAENGQSYILKLR